VRRELWSDFNSATHLAPYFLNRPALYLSIILLNSDHGVPYCVSSQQSSSWSFYHLTCFRPRSIIGLSLGRAGGAERAVVGESLVPQEVDEQARPEEHEQRSEPPEELLSPRALVMAWAVSTAVPLESFVRIILVRLCDVPTSPNERGAWVKTEKAFEETLSQPCDRPLHSS